MSVEKVSGLQIMHFALYVLHKLFTLILLHRYLQSRSNSVSIVIGCGVH